MTHYQKLDMLLNGLLSRVPYRNTYTITKYESNLTMEFLCTTMFANEKLTDWETKFIQDRLIGDEYVELITVDNVLVPNITQKGIKFIQNGGYEKEQERQKMHDEMVLTTIENNNRSKIAIIISIISLSLSAFALFIDFLLNN